MNKENIIFEDENFYVVHLKENANSIGHVRIYPQKEITNLEDLGNELFTRMFTMASLAATLVWENAYNVDSRATAIIMKSGANATHEKRGYFEIVLREADDGIDTKLDSKEPDFHEFAYKLKDEAFIKQEMLKQEAAENNSEKPGENEVKKEPQEEESKPAINESKDENQNKNTSESEESDDTIKEASKTAEDEGTQVAQNHQTPMEKYKEKLKKNYKLRQIERLP